MLPSRPPDYPSLYSVGFHRLSLDELQKPCVDNFPLSTSRKPIMAGLNTFFEKLEKLGFFGEVWVDGSFLTEKIDPDDADVLLRCDGPCYDNGNEAYRAAVDWAAENQKKTLRCHSHVFFEYPDGHPLHVDGEWWRIWWHRQWGFSREDDPKGIVVILLSGNSA